MSTRQTIPQRLSPVRHNLLCEFVIVLVLAANPLWGVQGHSQGTTPLVIYGSEKSFLQKYAAEELIKYLSLATGMEFLAVSDNQVEETSAVRFILLGNPQANPRVAKISTMLEKGITIPSSPEGFLIQRLNHQEKQYLLIAGGDDIGTLYGVYYYLERFVGVGFFLDAERVPQLEAVPFDNIETVVRTPRYRYRHIIGSLGPDVGTGVKPFRGHYWTVEENKHFVDWMVKNNFNMTLVHLGPREGGIYEQLHPEDKQTQFRWPPEYRKMMFKQICDYARQRGILVWYHGSIFFVLSNDEKYHRVEEVKDWTLWKRTMDTFGTDHFYLSTMGEAALSDELLEEHITQLEVMSKVDPEGRPIFDTWDLYLREVPKVKAMKYINTLPRNCLIYDTAADWIPTYKKYDYYGGRDWTIGIIHCMTPWDELHSQIRHYVELFKDVASDPRAVHCQGLISMPEHVVPTYDALFGYALGKLAYNPDYVEYEDLLKNFVRLRYGAKSSARMLDAIKLLERFNHNVREPANVHVNHKWYSNFPLHRAIWGWARPHKWFEPVIEFHQLFRFKASQDLSLLKQAMKITLDLAGELKNELPYQNDLFEISRTYASQVLSKQILVAIYYYKQATLGYAQDNQETGDKFRDKFTAVTGEAAQTMKCLDNLLRSNERYSIKKMLEDITHVVNAHPEAMRLTKDQFWWGDGYMRNENYEGFHYIYQPETMAFFRFLSRRLQDRNIDIVKFPVPDFSRELEAIRNRYLGRLDYLPQADHSNIISAATKIMNELRTPSVPDELYLKEIEVERFFPEDDITH